MPPWPMDPCPEGQGLWTGALCAGRHQYRPISTHPRRTCHPLPVGAHQGLRLAHFLHRGSNPTISGVRPPRHRRKPETACASRHTAGFPVYGMILALMATKKPPPAGWLGGVFRRALSGPGLGRLINYQLELSSEETVTGFLRWWGLGDYLDRYQLVAAPARPAEIWEIGPPTVTGPFPGQILPGHSDVECFPADPAGGFPWGELSHGGVLGEWSFFSGNLGLGRINSPADMTERAPTTTAPKFMRIPPIVSITCWPFLSWHWEGSLSCSASG